MPAQPPRGKGHPESQGQDTPSHATDKPARKPYRKPVLANYGDIRDVTLSPSPGVFESGPGVGFRSTLP